MSRRRKPPTAQEELDLPPDPDGLAAYDAEIAARRTERLAAAAGRAVALDCETAGQTLCWPCTLDGPHRCLEIHVAPEVHDACVAEARRLAAARGGAQCHDCAFLRDSHEHGQEGLIAQLARQRVAFHCHQGMPLDGRGKTPEEGDYAPDDRARYPICAGWAAARASYLARVLAARALRSVVWALRRRRPPRSKHEQVLRELGLVAFDEPRHRIRRPQLGRVARCDLCLWCTTSGRRALRGELAIAQQRLVIRGFGILGDLHRRELGGVVEHRIELRATGVHEPGALQLATPWIPGPPAAVLDAFAVVLYRAGCRAKSVDPPRPPPPYTRPPKNPSPPTPRRRRVPRRRPPQLLLRAA